MKFYNNKIDDIYNHFETSETGLTESQVNKLFSVYGKNVLEEKKGKSKFKIFLNQFNDAMIIILLIVAVIMGIYGYFYSHEYTDPIVITVVVLINAIMGFIQEQKAEVRKAINESKIRVDINTKIVNFSEVLIFTNIFFIFVPPLIPNNIYFINLYNSFTSSLPQQINFQRTDAIDG